MGFLVGSKHSPPPGLLERPAHAGVDALLKAGGKRFESTSPLGGGKFESVIASQGKLYAISYPPRQPDSKAEHLTTRLLAGDALTEAAHSIVHNARKQGALTPMAKPPTGDRLQNCVAVDITLPGATQKTVAYLDKKTNDLFVRKDGGWGNTTWSTVSPTKKSLHGW